MRSDIERIGRCSWRRAPGERAFEINVSTSRFASCRNSGPATLLLLCLSCSLTNALFCTIRFGLLITFVAGRREAGPDQRRRQQNAAGHCSSLTIGGVCRARAQEGVKFCIAIVSNSVRNNFAAQKRRNEWISGATIWRQSGGQRPTTTGGESIEALRRFNSPKGKQPAHCEK